MKLVELCWKSNCRLLYSCFSKKRGRRRRKRWKRKRRRRRRRRIKRRRRRFYKGYLKGLNTASKPPCPWEEGKGNCHDWADAEWIVIRRPLRGHNDTSFGQPTPGRPRCRPRVGHPQGVFVIFSNY
jgi:hypothetical protein